MFKKIVTLLILVIFPISLFFTNTFGNFTHYIIPAILVVISYLLFTRSYKYYFIPIFIIPFIEPKFVLLPLILSLLNLNKKNLMPIILSTALLIIFFKPFFGQTVLVRNRDAEQKIIQKSNLYNSVILARIFQNKPRYYIDGFTSNLSENLDLNNYFFGFAPRQIRVDDQNLINFPFLSLPFFIIGLYYLNKNKNKKFILAISIAILISLSILTNYDRNDFISWVPMSLIIIYGLNIFEEKIKTSKNKYLIFTSFSWQALLIVFSSIEILRLFIK